MVSGRHVEVAADLNRVREARDVRVPAAGGPGPAGRRWAEYSNALRRPPPVMRWMWTERHAAGAWES
jgi:hypothetical protein